MAVVWSERARNDLGSIFRFIARDDRGAAERWVARLVERAESVMTLPLAGRVVPEVGRQDVRETFLRTYRIVYRVRGDDVCILTVFEGHRLFTGVDLEDE